MAFRDPIILDDDDIIFIRDPTHGLRAWIDKATAGNDHLIWTGTQPVIIFGGTGNDRLEKTPFSSPVQFYGDNPSGGFEPRAGARFGGGDDTIDFAWGDIVKSGEGQDTYRGAHGDRHGRPPAKLFINWREDDLVTPAQSVRVRDYELIDIERDGSRFTATIDFLRLRFKTNDAFADPVIDLILAPDRPGEDRPDAVVSWRGDGMDAAVDRFVDRAHDGVGNDFIFI